MHLLVSGITDILGAFFVKVQNEALLKKFRCVFSFIYFAEKPYI
jgi:hypothetical protein